MRDFIWGSVLCAGLVGLISGCGGDSSSPSEPSCIQSVDSSTPYDGKTYDEWTAAWWDWVYGAPGSTNPLLDTTGAHCAVGQDEKSPVFFLGGTLGTGAATRTCAVPDGKALFFPVLNAEVDNFGAPQPMTNAELKAEALSALKGDVVSSLTATADGCDLTLYKEEPFQYSYTVPPGDNIYKALGQPGLSGNSGPAFTQGYWVMLAPLPAGTHTVAFGGQGMFSGTTYTVKVTYTLDVQ